MARSYRQWNAVLVLALLLSSTLSLLASPDDVAMPQAVATGNTTQRDQVEVDKTIPVNPPQLLYLAWQKGGDRATGQPIPHNVWDTKGIVLPQEKADTLLKGVRSFDVHWRQEGELPPLTLVFNVDREIAHSPVVPAVITTDGKRHSGSTARNASSNGLIVSAVFPRARDLAKWPKKITIEFTYAIEDRAIIRTLRNVPAEPIDIAPGIQWYLDPARALIAAPGQRKLVRAVGKTAGVLQISKVRADPLTAYGVRVYLRDKHRPIGSSHATIIEIDGKLHEIRVSDAFDNKDQIERIEIIRQRHQARRIENVPLRLDLLPEVE